MEDELGPMVMSPNGDERNTCLVPRNPHYCFQEILLAKHRLGFQRDKRMCLVTATPNLITTY